MSPPMHLPAKSIKDFKFYDATLVCEHKTLNVQAPGKSYHTIPLPSPWFLGQASPKP